METKNEMSHKYPLVVTWVQERQDVIVGIIAFLLVLASTFAWSLWMSDRSSTVVSSTDIGATTNAHFIDGMSVDNTRVETDLGVYLVYGTFQATKGQRVVLEERKNKDRVLCVKGTRLCYHLVD
jgi:hypothetical protein